MATTIYDVTLLQGLIGLFNAIVGVSYLILGWYIMRNKTYLKWKPHIYPVTMWGCFTFGISLMWYAGTDYYTELDFHEVIMHFFQFAGASAIGYAVWQDVERLVYKFDKMEEQRNEITKLNRVIENLKKNRNLKILLLMFSLLLVTNCGGMKKEIDRLKTEQTTSKSEYEKRTSELNSKITEKESQEKTTAEIIREQKNQIETLKSEKSQLTEKINQQNKDDVSIKGAVGNVKVTDANGNTYEIPSTIGTEINKKSESTLSRELSEIREVAESYRQQAINTVKELFTKDKIIKEKDAEITLSEKLAKKTAEKNKELAIALSKNVTRTATPIWVWLLTGAGLMLIIVIALSVAWKKFGGGIIERLNLKR